MVNRYKLDRNKNKYEMQKFALEFLNIELTNFQLDFLFGRQLGTSTARLIRLLYRIMKDWNNPRSYFYLCNRQMYANELYHKAVDMVRDNEKYDRSKKLTIYFKNGSKLIFDSINNKTAVNGIQNPVVDYDFMDLLAEGL